MRITKVYKYTAYQNIPRYISNAIAMANCIKLKLLELDENDVEITKKQYILMSLLTFSLKNLFFLFNHF
jgi:hypothetical protein